ncbi:MAG TPA: signal recognition particle-docking protein FtsY [Magnetospirillaceae bacterium]
MSDKPGWFGRLRQGLKRSSARLGQGIGDLFAAGKRVDAESLAGLEDLLITADLGTAAAARLTELLRAQRFEGQDTVEAVKAALAESITATLAPVAQPLVPDPGKKPFVVLVVGVNGSGKTTSIGKLAKHFRDDGKSVTLVAGDTFRAAAVEQLKIWGERTKSPVVAREQGADAAGLAFDAMAEAKARGDDLLLIDTAGRLQNKADLMAELTKMVRVIKRQDETAPHEVLLVLDATVGQNAHSQVETFKQLVAVTGLAVTKLDGTAKGGVLVALAERFNLPVRFIGIGEGVDDLRPFEADAFARGLLGID